MIDKNIVQKWLVEEGMFKNEISDDKSNFHFIINYPENHIMDLIQPLGKEDMLLIGCATEIDPSQIEAISSASSELKRNFIWDIKLTLNQFLLDFELEHPNDVLQRFVITDEIYEDGISKNNLILYIKKVFKGKLQCIWKLNKIFGEFNSKSNINNNYNIKNNNNNNNNYI
jgi:hypothetical protein